ncbi:MAG: response regulator transcription factor [bacterium]|nr:response regulator transcription factor [bacterium]
MSVLPQVFEPAVVSVQSSDPTLQAAVERLLSLDPEIAVATATESAGAIRVDERFLDEFRDLTVGQLLDVLKSMPRPHGSGRRHLQPLPTSAREMRSVLSDREFQVVRLVAEGLSNKEISRRLELSDQTVKNHISHILAKLNLSARTQVAIHALRAGIV